MQNVSAVNIFVVVDYLSGNVKLEISENCVPSNIVIVAKPLP